MKPELLLSTFKHSFGLCLIHPVYSLHASCGKSNYFQLSSSLHLVTLRLLFISLALPRPRGFQSVQWVTCTNILPFCVGNRWANTANNKESPWSTSHCCYWITSCLSRPHHHRWAPRSMELLCKANLFTNGFATAELTSFFFFFLPQILNENVMKSNLCSYHF